MRKLLITLLAAASLTPAMALAQDHEPNDRHDRPTSNGQRPQGNNAPRPQGDNGGRQFNGGVRPQFQQPQGTPQPQAAPQPRQFQRQAPQAQAITPAGQGEQGWRGDRNSAFGNRGGQPQFQPQNRPNFDGNRGQFQRNTTPTPPVVNQAEISRGGGYDGRRGGSFNGNRQGWNGGTGYQNNGNRGYYNDRNDDRRDNQRWNNNWHNDNRYDWRSNRSYNRDLYRLPRYYAPYGYNYGYQRFGIGFRLNALLFSQSYWIGDPEYYRLPDAYGPYRWVRYYDDALLVDIYSGEVVDVVHDIFW